MFGVKSLFIINFYFLFAISNEDGIHYEKGMEAYKNNQFEFSVQEFENILENGWRSSELYYNLGNAYYRLGDIAGSIWSYESCLMIEPNHHDAKYNLKLANLKVKDRVEFPDPPFYLKFYMSINEQYSPSTWIFISTCLLFLSVFIITIKKIVLIDLLQYASSITLTMFFLSLFITLHSIINKNSNLEGVIYQNKISAFSEPDEFSTRLFEVNEGLKVEIGQMKKNWLEVELLDGKNGWIEKEGVRLIQ